MNCKTVLFQHNSMLPPEMEKRCALGQLALWAVVVTSVCTGRPTRS